MLSEKEMLGIISEKPYMLEAWVTDFGFGVSQAVCDEAVRRLPRMLRYVPAELQTEEMCVAAVGNDYTCLSHVKDPTFPVIDAAFAEYGRAMTDPDVALKYRGGKLLYSPLSSLRGEKTKEVYLCAVSHWPFLVGSIPESCLDDKICIKALEKDPAMFCRIPRGRRTEAVCMAAVRGDGLSLCMVPRQTPEICRAAVEQNPEAARYVEDKSMLEEAPSSPTFGPGM